MKPDDTPQNDATVRPATVSAVARVNVGGVQIGYVPGWGTATNEAERVLAILNTQGRWMLQWWALGRARDVIQQCYGGAPMSNVWAVHSVELACLASQWLEEHLEEEGFPAKHYRESNVDLTDACDLANTHKHAGRDRRKRVGRVVTFTMGSDRAAIELAFARRGDDVATLKDALVLVDGCFDAWHAFLVENGLDPLPPPGG